MPSRWPWRLPLAVSISFSTSRSVRCSRGRSSLLGRRVGVTVRFTVAGETSLRRVFAICFKPPGRSTVRILSGIRTVVNGGTVAPLHWRITHDPLPPAPRTIGLEPGLSPVASHRCARSAGGAVGAVTKTGGLASVGAW